MPPKKKQDDQDAPKSNESAEAKANRGYVRYVNTANERHIRPQDLAEIGFSKKDDLVLLSWTAENQWCVPRADIPDEVYERAIVPDNDFILVEPED